MEERNDRFEWFEEHEPGENQDTIPSPNVPPSEFCGLDSFIATYQAEETSDFAHLSHAPLLCRACGFGGMALGDGETEKQSIEKALENARSMVRRECGNWRARAILEGRSSREIMPEDLLPSVLRPK